MMTLFVEKEREGVGGRSKLLTASRLSGKEVRECAASPRGGYPIRNVLSK